MGYSGEGSDDLETVLLSTRCFAVALGHLLKEGEGVCVELSPDGNEPSRKYVVFREEGQIKINEGDPLVKYGDIPLKGGCLVWVHKAEEN